MSKLFKSLKNLFLIIVMVIIFTAPTIFAKEIVFTTIMPSQEVIRSKSGVVGNYDANGDGDYNDAGEWEYRNIPEANIGDNNLIIGGNVGIGTANPQAKLHVGGTAGADGIMFPDGTLQTTSAEVGESSLTQNGYITLPGGLILQWGRYSSNTDNNQSFLFPITFPNTCFNVQTTPTGANARAYSTRVVSVTTTGFVVNRHNSLDGVTLFFWSSIGY